MSLAALLERLVGVRRRRPVTASASFGSLIGFVVLLTACLFPVDVVFVPGHFALAHPERPNRRPDVAAPRPPCGPSRLRAAHQERAAGDGTMSNLTLLPGMFRVALCPVAGDLAAVAVPLRELSPRPSVSASEAQAESTEDCISRLICDKLHEVVVATESRLDEVCDHASALALAILAMPPAGAEKPGGLSRFSFTDRTWARGSNHRLRAGREDVPTARRDGRLRPHRRPRCYHDDYKLQRIDATVCASRSARRCQVSAELFFVLIQSRGTCRDNPAAPSTSRSARWCELWRTARKRASLPDPEELADGACPGRLAERPPRPKSRRCSCSRRGCSSISAASPRATPATRPSRC